MSMTHAPTHARSGKGEWLPSGCLEDPTRSTRHAHRLGRPFGALPFGAAVLVVATASIGVGCGGAQRDAATQTSFEGDEVEKTPQAFPTKPPESGPPSTFSLPTIHRKALSNGLEVNVLQMNELPVVYLDLVVFSGRQTDGKTVGLSALTASLMNEGTENFSGAELAEAFESLGASLKIHSDSDNLYVAAVGLSTHFSRLLSLMVEPALKPTFPGEELDKLVRRERNRLSLKAANPNFLAYRTLYKALYANHPYANIDVETRTLDRLKRQEVARWHDTYVRPNNATLVVAGAVDPEKVFAEAETAFGAWEQRAVKPISATLPKASKARRILLVDRPGSVQSIIAIGNLALKRKDENFIPLAVANQVLGGSAASRLFMDLREKRSLTYGAYSSLGERVDVAPFIASAAVRTEVTGEALEGFFEHLDLIRNETVPPEELADAARYLTDKFPLKIETAGQLAGLVGELRIFGLPDDYWEQYNKGILEVDAVAAQRAAQAYIKPETATVVVVGDAERISDEVRLHGDVEVVSAAGKSLGRLRALKKPPAPPAPAEEAPAAAGAPIEEPPEPAPADEPSTH